MFSNYRTITEGANDISVPEGQATVVPVVSPSDGILTTFTSGMMKTFGLVLMGMAAAAFVTNQLVLDGINHSFLRLNAPVIAIACSFNQVASSDGKSCVCPIPDQILQVLGANSIGCACPAGKILSPDGKACQCAPNGMITTTMRTATRSETTTSYYYVDATSTPSQCFPCPPGTDKGCEKVDFGNNCAVNVALPNNMFTVVRLAQYQYSVKGCQSPYAVTSYAVASNKANDGCNDVQVSKCCRISGKKLCPQLTSGILDLCC